MFQVCRWCKEREKADVRKRVTRLRLVSRGSGGFAASTRFTEAGVRVQAKHGGDCGGRSPMGQQRLKSKTEGDQPGRGITFPLDRRGSDADEFEAEAQAMH